MLFPMSRSACHLIITPVSSLLRKGCLNLLIVIAILVAVPLVWRAAVKVYFNGSIYNPTEVVEKPVALVFGAAVYGNGRLSPVLRDRVDTAVALYHAGAVDHILMSGDNRSADYDEPGAMMEYAIENGVHPGDITVDRAGHRTYDTCYRAKRVFNIGDAVLVTQAFHLPRALLTCEGLGIDAVGVTADRRTYRGATWYEIRETGATLVAAWDLARNEPPPVWGTVEESNILRPAQLAGGN